MFVDSFKEFVYDISNERWSTLTSVVRATILGSGQLLIRVHVRPAILLLWFANAVGRPVDRGSKFLKQGHVRPIYALSHPSDVYPLRDYRRGGCSADVKQDGLAVKRSSTLLLDFASFYDSE
jgi:hypothetical protein